MALFKLDEVFTYQDANDIKEFWATTNLAGETDGAEEGEIRLDLGNDPIRLMRRNQNAAPAECWDVIGQMPAADILTELKTVDGSGSGLDADKLDGVEGTSYLRTDQEGTLNGTLNCPGSRNVIVFDGGHSRITVHDGSGNLNIKAGVDDSGQIIDTDGGSHIKLMETGEITLLATDSTVGSAFSGGNYLKVAYWGVTVNGGTVWHSANDGSGSGLDADKLDGQDGSYYQNASNLNAGTVPADRLALWRNDDDDSTTGLFIQCGLRHLYSSAAAAKTFSEAFTSSVVVVATSETSGEFCSVTSVTSTGFSLRHPTESGMARWIAVGKKV